MNEYATVAEVLKAFEFTLQMVLFCMVVSLLVVYSWIMKFVLSAIDFIDDMRERKAQHSAHVRVYYQANFRPSPKLYISMVVIFTLFCLSFYMFFMAFKSPQMM